MNPSKCNNRLGSRRGRVLSFLCVALLFAAGGCSSLGARAMKGERTLLNTALQQTNDEQLLINLVRFRYGDTPAFLQVSSISSQLALDVGMSAGAELESSKPNRDLLLFGASAGYATRPTLSYVPLQGNEFIQQLLTPLTTEKILLLYRSGWHIKRLFTICVQGMNGLKNAPRASGPTPGRAPEYEDFSKAVDLLRELERRDLVSILHAPPASGKGAARVVLHMDPKAQALPETRALFTLLNLSPNRLDFPLVYTQLQATHLAPVDVIEIDTRSLLGLMFFLSNGVQAPEKDVKEGRVKVTSMESGQPFDWKAVLGDYLKVHADDQRPSDTQLRVNYRGHWFYIDDRDMESKATFTFLSQVFSLQAGKAEGIVPVLTLPVGR
ncbi:MAG: hypothetical protein U5R49_25545 [Deltaproteobacteria bacterium]|nr:hypothetical protein [Deltaproteobacteria bacterium]